MKLIPLVCIFLSTLMLSCASSEKVKTTKVYIEIGAPTKTAANTPENQAVVHKSKKSYSGYQHQTKLSQNTAYSTDSSSKPVK